MTWPLSQDFNEAVQNPSTAFSDPDLKGGRIGTNPMGVPIPRSGNYADVYQVTSASGQKWAVKCFTRPTSTGLDQRYAAVSEHLASANLPFTVGFSFLPQGVRVRGQWYPIVKMQWVDGFPINAFVRENLNRSTILENMLSLWVRLCRRLRETGMAHCDIQHGNVLLVPAEGRGNSLGLKLVDYDGMFVPALATLPSGEAGHPCFQHPERIATGAYSPDLDRFPHLVVATALRGLLVGGKSLWDKYDNGDNLLFTEKDFQNPGQSKIFKELWETGDPFTVGLAGHLALACTKSLHQTPWLDQLMPGGQPPILTPSQERQAAAIISGQPITPEPTMPGSMPQIVIPPHYSHPPYGPAHYPPQPAAPHQYEVPKPPVAPPVPQAAPARGMSFDSDSTSDEMEFGTSRRRRRNQSQSGSTLILAGIAGVVVMGSIVGGIIYFTGKGKKPSEVLVQKPDETKPDEKKSDPPITTPDPLPVNSNGKSNTVPMVNPPQPRPQPNDLPKIIGKVVWSKPAGEQRNQLARSVQFSLDGNRVIVAQERTGLIDIRDAATGDVIATFREHTPPATAFPFPLPNDKVMSIAREPVMMAWDASNGQATARAPLAQPKAGITAVRADAKGQYAIICWDEDASVIEIENGGRSILDLKMPKGPFGNPGVAIAPDGSRVLALTTNGSFREYSLPELSPLEKPCKVENAASIIAWSPTQKLAAIRRFKDGQLPGHLTIVNTETGEIAHTLRGGYALPAEFSADGRLFIAFDKGHLEQWDTETWTKNAFVPLQGTTPTSFSVSADGQRVAVTGTNQQIQLAVFSKDAKPTIPSPGSVSPPDTPVRRLTEVVALNTTDVNLDAIRSWAVDRTGKTLYFATDAAFYPVDWANKKFTSRYAPVEGRIRQIWATAAGEVVLEVRNQRVTELHVLDGTSGRLTGPGIIRPSLTDTPKSIHVGSNGTMAVITKDNGHVACLDLKTGRTLYTFHPKMAAESAFCTSTADKIIVNCVSRIEVYPFAERPKFQWFNPSRNLGIETIQLEAVSDDGRRAVLRTPGADNNGTRFTIVSFEGWKAISSVSSAMTRGAVQFRFLGNSDRGILREENQTFLIDILTGKRISTATSQVVTDNSRSIPSPSGEYVLLGSSTGVALFRTTDAPVTVVEVPVPAGPRRLAIPSEEQRAQANKAIREMYADDFAKKLPPDRKRLGDQLYTDARQMAKEPPEQYVMLKEALAIGIEVQDSKLIMDSADALDEVFEVNGFDLKVAGLEKIASTSTQSAALKQVAESIQELSEELANQDQFEKAIKLNSIAISCYNRSGSVQQQRDLETRQAQLRTTQDAFQAVLPAVEKLKTMPGDPESSTVVGQFRCFQQGRWEDGFRLLVNASNPALKKLAEMELNATSNFEMTDVQRGDLWWDYAESIADPNKSIAKGRAKFWYSKGLESVAVGPDRENAVKRLSFTWFGNEYRPGVVVEVFQPAGSRVKTKGLITNTIDAKVDNTEIISDTGTPTAGLKWVGVIVAPSPGRYKIIADTQDDIRITFGTKPDEKKIISTVDKGMGNRDAYYVFSDKPVVMLVEYAAQKRRDRGIILKWIPPGSKSEERIPASVLFHKRDDEKLVTDE